MKQSIQRPVRTRGGWLLAICLMTAAVVRADDGIKVYRIAKSASAPRLPANHPPMDSGESAISFTTPAGWTATKPGEMRVASFNIAKGDKQADVGVFPLPGSAGGDVANVNRWRGQVGLSPLAEDALKKTAETVQIAGAPAELYDVSGTNAAGDPARILGVIQHRSGKAWFFKVNGDDQLVAENKPAFVEFLKSLRFVSAPATDDLPASQPPAASDALPAGHPEISTSASTGVVERDGQPKWTPPSGWKEVSGGQFLVAKFVIAGEGGAQAAVNVSRSAGEAGGLEGNVNRWRGQLGLPAQSPEEIQKATAKLAVTDGTATVVEMSGTDARSSQPAKLVGVMVPRAGETWFYKLMGDPGIVDAQRDAFTKFVASVKY